MDLLSFHISTCLIIFRLSGTHTLFYWYRFFLPCYTFCFLLLLQVLVVFFLINLSRFILMNSVSVHALTLLHYPWTSGRRIWFRYDIYHRKHYCHGVSCWGFELWVFWICWGEQKNDLCNFISVLHNHLISYP